MHDIQKIVLSIVPLLFAIILHEVAHGWVAEKLGDPTARLLGRITLNPISHIDPIGTIILPGILLLTGSPFLFGWAKPVPVNFGNLRGGRRDMALVALSGPLTNFFLAVLSSIIFHLTFGGIAGPAGISARIIVPVHVMALYSVHVQPRADGDKSSSDPSAGRGQDRCGIGPDADRNCNGSGWKDTECSLCCS